MKSKEDLALYLKRARESCKNVFGDVLTEEYLKELLDKRIKQDLEDFFLGKSGHFSYIHLSTEEVLEIRKLVEESVPLTVANGVDAFEVTYGEPIVVIGGKLPDVDWSKVKVVTGDEPKKRGRPKKQPSY